MQEAQSVWHLAWPIMIAQLAQTGMGFVDAVMAGRVSADDLAAVSLGVSVWVIIIVTLMGLMMAISPAVSQLYGAKEYHRIPHTVRQGLWMALGLALLAWAIGLGTLPVFSHIGLSPTVEEKARQFVIAVCFGLPAFTWFRILANYSASINRTRPMMVIGLIGLILNIPFNYILIYGKFGLPALGGVGCGYASALCGWISCLLLAAWIYWAEPYRDTMPFDRWEGPNWQEISQLLKLGVPIGITYFAEVTAFSLVALLIAKFGSVQIAAHQIALNFSSMVFMIPMSFGLACLVRVGQAVGEGDPYKARYSAWVGVGMSLAYAICSASFIALAASTIAGWYSQDEAVIKLASHFLLYAALFQLSDATQVSTSCAMRGYKSTRIPMLIHMTAFWGLSLPLGCVLGLAPDWIPFAPAKPMAAEGFWIAIVASLTLAAILLSWQLDKLSRRRIADAARPH
ncbi:MATE family efflux transporter [Parachitinimonas caeni]|uniref:Multidrug-efflux transporter n=1 Tax=Parachitinimonas caeni TaxID=3031301 RepID=A0ABT7E1V8_9NEIS|nr:MATE family efflux transporter [Parachitinimonas caeni]MDK2126302.1 MATE family efflux transporter [Parachitinimonas caeni]